MGISRNKQLDKGMRIASKAQECEGITRKGIPCRQYPMKGCKYCYIHSVGRFKGVAWWKNPVIHLIIGIFVSTLFFSLGPSRKNQEKVLVIQSQTQASINKLLQRTEESLHERLLKDYPLGYCLFYSDGKRFLYQDYRSEIIRIDWSYAKIEVTQKRIRVSLPNWMEMRSGARFIDSVYYLERVTGKTIGRDRWRIGGIAFPVMECISTDENSVVVAVGFDQKS